MSSTAGDATLETLDRLVSELPQKGFDFSDGVAKLLECSKFMDSNPGVPQSYVAEIEQRATAIYNLARKCFSAQDQAAVLLRFQACVLLQKVFEHKSELSIGLQAVRCFCRTYVVCHNVLMMICPTCEALDRTTSPHLRFGISMNVWFQTPSAHHLAKRKLETKVIACEKISVKIFKTLVEAKCAAAVVESGPPIGDAQQLSSIAASIEQTQQLILTLEQTSSSQSIEYESIVLLGKWRPKCIATMEKAMFEAAAAALRRAHIRKAENLVKISDKLLLQLPDYDLSHAQADMNQRQYLKALVQFKMRNYDTVAEILQQSMENNPSPSMALLYFRALGSLWQFEPIFEQSKCASSESVRASALQALLEHGKTIRLALVLQLKNTGLALTVLELAIFWEGQSGRNRASFFAEAASLLCSFSRSPDVISGEARIIGVTATLWNAVISLCTDASTSRHVLNVMNSLYSVADQNVKLLGADFRNQLALAIAVLHDEARNYDGAIASLARVVSPGEGIKLVTQELKVKVLVFSTLDVSPESMRPVVEYAQEGATPQDKASRCIQLVSWVFQVPDQQRRRQLDLLLCDHFSDGGVFSKPDFDSLFVDFLIFRYKSQRNLVFVDSQMFMHRTLNILTRLGATLCQSVTKEDTQQNEAPAFVRTGDAPGPPSFDKVQCLTWFMYFTALDQPCDMHQPEVQQRFVDLCKFIPHSKHQQVPICFEKSAMFHVVLLHAIAELYSSKNIVVSSNASNTRWCREQDASSVDGGDNPTCVPKCLSLDLDSLVRKACRLCSDLKLKDSISVQVLHMYWSAVLILLKAELSFLAAKGRFKDLKVSAVKNAC